MLTVGGCTPYNALYGRVPQILPSIDQVRPPGEAETLNPGTLAHVHRLREVAVQAMIEGSARARLGRSMNTRTTASAQNLNLQVGEEVDYFRQPSQKDTSGWIGPATVVDVSRAARGVVSVRYQSRVLEVQLQHVRRHLHYFALLSSQQDVCRGQRADADNIVAYPSAYTNVWAAIKSAVEQLNPGRVVQVGKVCHQDRWVVSANNTPLPEMMSAVKFFGENHLQLANVVSARIATGIAELPAIKGYSSAVTLMWRPWSTYTRLV